MATERKGRLYKRPGRQTWYADLRDLGEGRKSTGESDYLDAEIWLNRELIEIRATLNGKQRKRDLGPGMVLSFSEHHLEAKKLNRRESTIQRDELSLRHFLTWAGEDILLSDVTPGLLNQYAHARTADGAAAQTVLHELHALSSMFKRAVAEGYVEVNPVSQMVDKPRIEREEPEWLEPEEAAAFLAECKGDLHTLVAIALFTGARKQEICGLQWEDVDFNRDLIQIRANKWRKLKRNHSKRSIKLWSQLRAILEPLAKTGIRFGPQKWKTGLVVPNRHGGMYIDVRGGMEGAGERAEIGKEVSWNTLRHTYASLRLQTVDNGAPISPFRVAKELGHKGLTMIFEHYGHVLESPQRLEMIEYKKVDVIAELKGEE